MLPFKEKIIEEKETYTLIQRDFLSTLIEEELNWHMDEEDREDGPNIAHLQQVWRTIGHQSAAVGRFHWGWAVFFEAVDSKAQDEER